MTRQPDTVGAAPAARPSWRAPLAFAALCVSLAVSPAVLAGCDRGQAANVDMPEPAPVVGSSFTKPTEISNPYYALVPGDEFVLEGTADRGEGLVPHQLIITVGDLVKEIHGVETVVVWEQDVNEGKVLETELAFFAQDDTGSVWSLGEYPEEYSEKGKFEGAPSTWISGRRGAIGGVQVPGSPSVGSPSFAEGYAPKIDFHDGGRVEAVGRQACGGVGCFPNALVIEEWNNHPADGRQLKNYVPDVGLVRVDPRGGDEDESLLLMSRKHLDPAGLAKARQAMLRLDQRAYRFGGDDYRSTPRAHPADGATA